ncbi:MAG: nitrous oxide reductase accessory protein NosL [Lewinellaceae bacterium]|nr:nitrous oxide reductase accessory protein NosL [Phaeodactylibacter sp.]MCB9037649.1 nitrous oxide reductase accessory protein NosL [Lewinellaceae bacterium]
MKRSKLLPALAMALSAVSCTPSPKPIAYGSDACHYCKMTIVDQQHAAEAVTAKGKAFKFDAIECMVNYLEGQEGQSQEYAFLLAADYEKPGELIPAESSYYLISPAIPSPMGAYLSAFETQERAKAMQSAKEGEVFDWKGLRAHIKN